MSLDLDHTLSGISSLFRNFSKTFYIASKRIAKGASHSVCSDNFDDVVVPESVGHSNFAIPYRVCTVRKRID